MTPLKRAFLALEDAEARLAAKQYAAIGSRSRLSAWVAGCLAAGTTLPASGG